jgi:hypothetical protein
MEKQQYVCLVCGFNMVNSHPQRCPFCGAEKEHFITADVCSARYKIVATPVNNKVTRLNSRPALGYEHAAFQIETGRGLCWIDCPSCFDPSVDPVETILFTHHHFLGASNLYRQEFGAGVHIHAGDALNELCRFFTFDAVFTESFTHQGIEAFPVDGHTPGFTLYLFEDMLFICDYVFLSDARMKFNPYGPADLTLIGGRRIEEILNGRKLATVCGYNYVVDYATWWQKFSDLQPKQRSIQQLTQRRREE